jgi:hypothetical protein
MNRIKDDAEGGLSAFLAAQQTHPAEMLVSPYLFDHRYEAAHAYQTLADTPDFVLLPGSKTALLDAIGTSITRMREHLEAMPEGTPPSEIIMVILPDGHDNASARWRSHTEIRRLIEEQTSQGWKFHYLDATPDAFTKPRTAASNETPRRRSAPTTPSRRSPASDASPPTAKTASPTTTATAHATDTPPGTPTETPAAARRRPWARCLGCGHRIWSTKSLLHRRGRQCRGRGHRRRGHGRPARAWQYVTGQTRLDLFTNSKETSMTTTAPTVDFANIATVFVADTLDDVGIDTTVVYGQDDQPEVTVILEGKPFRLHLTQLPAEQAGN